MDLIQKGKEVDNYFNSKLIDEDEVMAEVLKYNSAQELPSIDVSPAQGKMLHLMAKMKGATSVLEIGTLGGYSTIWLARALPENGQVVTLEFSPKHAEVAEENIRRAGVEDKVEILVGKALDTLPVLKNNGDAHFDFIFIDADKKNNPYYLKWALELAEPGAVVIIDNVVRGGRVADAESEDKDIVGTRACFDMLASEDRIDATSVQTLGSKGYDGFVLGIVAR
ncbi:O-methyltransferase [Thalassobacillus hwangdonensis]|uniref:O-methyltransferase n=1 Tax=Thalassobacillus hwangdonensis TaxID=546108 RepID=A0ABW3L0Z0_9BACI